MNREEYLWLLGDFYKKNLEISERKSNDYAGENPFGNFLLSEMAGVSVEKGLLVRIGDKFSRINNLLSGIEQKVSDESVKDTLRDLSNYAAILYVWLDNQND